MSITIYSVGGCGINIAKQVADLDVTINYIDTSKSNLGTLVGENVYLVDAMDGAGKDRSVAYNNFKDSAADVLVRYKPSEQLNIVIGSLSGGKLAV